MANKKQLDEYINILTEEEKQYIKDCLNPTVFYIRGEYLIKAINDEINGKH